MRNEYLCKAKRKDTGEWVIGYLVVDEQDESKTFVGYVFGTNEDGTPHDFDMVEVLSDTICRCTGFEDINGKLMFENDILEYSDAGYEGKLPIGTIVWGKAQWLIVWEHDEVMSDRNFRQDLYFFATQRQMSVVGNKCL